MDKNTFDDIDGHQGEAEKQDAEWQAEVEDVALETPLKNLKARAPLMGLRRGHPQTKSPKRRKLLRKVRRIATRPMMRH